MKEEPRWLLVTFGRIVFHSWTILLHALHDDRNIDTHGHRRRLPAGKILNIDQQHSNVVARPGHLHNLCCIDGSG